MAFMYGSGNETVDRMASVGIVGNVVPHTWYKTIVRENGKPHLLAISILSDIVYWYRPQEIRDEATGHLIRYQKKFAGNLLQKTYDAYAEFFGESKRTVKQAMDVLVGLGVVKRQFRTIVTEGQTPLANVMFLDLDVKNLTALTFPEETPVVDNLSTKKDEVELSTIAKPESYPQLGSADVAKPAENKDFPEIDEPVCHLVQNNVPHGTKFCTTPYKTMYPPVQNNVPPPTEFCNTYYKEYAENTTKTTTESLSPFHSYLVSHTREELAEHLEQKLKEQISFSKLTTEYVYSGKAFGEALRKIASALAEEADWITIGTKRYPYSLASMRFASATEFTFRQALEDIRVGIDRRDEMVEKLFAAPLHYPSR